MIEAFARVPPNKPILAKDLEPDRSPMECLRVARRLEQSALVQMVRQRPKTVEVATNPFARSLHGLLRSRGYYRQILRESHLRIIGLMATDPDPRSSVELAERSGLHRNTVQPVLRDLADRALLIKIGTRYTLAPHAVELRHLGDAFIESILNRELTSRPNVRPVTKRAGRLVVESDDPVPDLDPTAVFRFQIEGAEVLASSYQYALVPFGAPTSLSDAFQDAIQMAVSPRTRVAIDRFLGKEVIEDA